jgi:uncharacterized membrane protein YphA (DoxX/SURF4 family)
VFAPAAAVFSGLLVVTGLAKLRRPDDTSRAIARLGLPNHPSVGLALGAVETLLGLAVLLTLAPQLLYAQAALYTVFVVWIAWAMRAMEPIASCGCLGTPDTPPYAGHLVVDVAGVVFSMAAALNRPPLSGPLTTAAMVGFGFVPVGVYLAWLIIGDGARLYGARAR